MSSLCLNTSSKGKSTTAQDRLFQCSTALPVEKYFLMVSQNLLSGSFQLVDCSTLRISREQVPPPLFFEWQPFRNYHASLLSSFFPGQISWALTMPLPAIPFFYFQVHVREFKNFKLRNVNHPPAIRSDSVHFTPLFLLLHVWLLWTSMHVNSRG